MKIWYSIISIIDYPIKTYRELSELLVPHADILLN